MQRIAAPFAALAPDDLQGSAVNEPLHRGPGEEGIANLLIAGASKAGTSSLFAYLAQHSDICRAPAMSKLAIPSSPGPRCRGSFTALP